VQERGIDVIVARDALRLPSGRRRPSREGLRLGSLSGLTKVSARDPWVPMVAEGDGPVADGPRLSVITVVATRLYTIYIGVLSVCQATTRVEQMTLEE
jgi:hypothetical protein